MVKVTGAIIEMPFYSKRHPFLMAVFYPKVLAGYRFSGKV